MNNILLAVLGALPSLITLIEKLFGSGSGAAKKKAVVDMAGVILTGLTAVSTGGQKNTMIAITPVISPVIDVLAGVIFPPGTTSNPTGISNEINTQI